MADRHCLDFFLTSVAGIPNQQPNSVFHAVVRFGNFPPIPVHAVNASPSHPGRFNFNVNHKCRFVMDGMRLRTTVSPLEVLVDLYDVRAGNGSLVGTAALPVRFVEAPIDSPSCRSVSLFDCYGRFCGVVDADCVVYIDPLPKSTAPIDLEGGSVIPPYVLKVVVDRDHVERSLPLLPPQPGATTTLKALSPTSEPQPLPAETVASTFQYEVLYQVRGLLDTVSMICSNGSLGNSKASSKDAQLFDVVDAVADIVRLANVCFQAVLDAHPGKQSPMTLPTSFSVTRPKAGTIRFVLCFEVLYQLRSVSQQASCLVSKAFQDVALVSLDEVARLYISKLVKKLGDTTRLVNILVQSLPDAPNGRTPPLPSKVAAKVNKPSEEDYSSDSFESESSTTSADSASLPFSPVGAVISSPARLLNQ